MRVVHEWRASQSGARTRALRNCEENRTASLPVLDLSPSCAPDAASTCDGAADRCNGSLQGVASADPIADALERVRTSWVADRDGSRLRRSLLELFAEISSSGL
jgi:hypothetical protein